jgi:hypothetical protein
MAKRVVMDADYRYNNNNNNNNIYTPSSCYHQPKPRFSLFSGNSTLSYVTNALCEASASLIAVTPSCALLSVFTVDSAPVLLYSALYFDALRRRRIVVSIDGVSHYYHHNNNNITNNNVEEGGGSNNNNNNGNASDVVMWMVVVAAGFVAWYVRQVCRTVPKDSNKPPSNSIEEVANRCQIPASFFNVGYGGTNHTTNNNSSIGGSSSNDAIIIGSNGYYYYANGGGSSWWCNQCFTWARAIWFTSRTLYRWMSTGVCFMVVHVMFNVPDDVIALSFVPTVVCAMSMSLFYRKEDEVRGGGKGGMIKALLGDRSAVMCVMNFIGLVELVVLTWSASSGDTSYYFYSYWGVGERQRALQHIATGPSAVLALVVMGIVYMESSPSLLCFVLRSLVLLSYFVLGVIHIGIIVSSELVVSVSRASGGGSMMMTQQCVVVDPSEPLNCPSVVVVGDGGNSSSASISNNSRPRGSSRGLVSVPSVVPDLCMLLLGSWILALWLDAERWSLALALIGGVELVSLLTCYLFFTVQPPSSS